MKTTSALFLVLFALQKVTSALRFPRYYAPGMVFQSAPANPTFFGLSNDVQNPVSIIQKCQESSFKRKFAAVLDPGTNIWSVNIIGRGNSESCEMTVIQGEQRLTLDIVFGDVILCSGQSNMVFRMYQLFNSSQEISDAKRYSNIRMFKIATLHSGSEQDDLIDDPDNWKTWISSQETDKFREFSAICFLYAKYLSDIILGRNHTFGLISSDVCGTRIEAWSSKEALNECNITDYKYPPNEIFSHSALFNAMIHPFIRHDIHSVLWYQGESNRDYNRDLYSCTFPALIRDWRRLWRNPSTPFGFVQLANNVGDGVELIRWHQTMDKGFVPNKPDMENTFMAVALDTYDRKGGIHPRFKQIVARRLAMAGANVAYKRAEYPVSGPILVNFTLGRKFINLEYDQALEYNGNAEISGFYYCTVDSTKCDILKNSWKHIPKANVIQESATKIKIITDEGWNMSSLAYLWEDSPVKAYLGAPIYAKTDIIQLPANPWKITLPPI